jgi:hypothetical protein
MILSLRVILAISSLLLWAVGGVEPPTLDVHPAQIVRRLALVG